MATEMVSGRPLHVPLFLYLVTTRVILDLNPSALVFAELVAESSVVNVNQHVGPTGGLRPTR